MSSSSSSEDELEKKVTKEQKKKETKSKVVLFWIWVWNIVNFQKRQSEAVEEEKQEVKKAKNEEEVSGRLKDSDGNEVIILLFINVK